MKNPESTYSAESVVTALEEFVRAVVRDMRPDSDVEDSLALYDAKDALIQALHNDGSGSGS